MICFPMIVGLVKLFLVWCFYFLGRPRIGTSMEAFWRHILRTTVASFSAFWSDSKAATLYVEHHCKFESFLQAGFFHGFIWMVMHLLGFGGRFNAHIYLKLVHWKLLTINLVYDDCYFWIVFTIHWEIFDPILVGMLSFVRNFAAFVMTYFDALKVRTIRLDRLPRVNVITALTDSSCSYRLSGRLIFILTLLLSILLVRCSCIVWSTGFAWIFYFMFRCPCFIGGSCHSHCF